MNELKKIRATKYKNKQRYKDKSKIIPKTENKDNIESNTLENKIIIDDDSRLFGKRGLQSNWYRYEPKEEDSVVHAKDFSLIASAPVSQGSYFQFKRDKIIDDEVESEQVLSKLFHLDLDMLNKSLATIPFYERCDIDEKYLTESQMNEMKENATRNVNFYEEHLEKIQQEQQKEKKLTSESEHCDNQNSKMFEQLSLSEAQDGNSQKEDIIIKEKGESEELEQWLDDILDD